MATHRQQPVHPVPVQPNPVANQRPAAVLPPAPAIALPPAQPAGLTEASLRAWVNAAGENEIEARQWLQKEILRTASDEDGTLVIKGNLEIAPVQNWADRSWSRPCAALTGLPAGLRIHGTLRLAECSKLSELPADLHVGQKIDISYCLALKSLSGLRFDGELVIGFSSVEDLGESVDVAALTIIGCPVQHVSENLTVRGDADVAMCHDLKSLAENVKVGGNLKVKNCRNTELGAKIDIGGDLSMEDLDVARLPGLKLGGSIFCENTPIDEVDLGDFKRIRNKVPSSYRDMNTFFPIAVEEAIARAQKVAKNEASSLDPELSAELRRLVYSLRGSAYFEDHRIDGTAMLIERLVIEMLESPEDAKARFAAATRAETPSGKASKHSQYAFPYSEILAPFDPSKQKSARK